MKSARTSLVFVVMMVALSLWIRQMISMWVWARPMPRCRRHPWWRRVIFPSLSMGVVADAPGVGVVGWGGGGFRDELVGERGGFVAEGAVRADVVVVLAERVEGGLEVGE